MTPGHVYAICAYVKITLNQDTDNSYTFGIGNPSYSNTPRKKLTISDDNYHYYRAYGTFTSGSPTNTNHWFYVQRSGVVPTYPSNPADQAWIYIKKGMVFDLTKMYGAGLEPTEEEFWAKYGEIYYKKNILE